MTPDESAWVEYVRRQLGDDAAEVARLEIMGEKRKAMLKRGKPLVSTDADTDATGLDRGQGMDYDPHHTGGLADPPDPID